MERVVVVGGGVLGTMHALAARRRGLDVLQLGALRDHLLARGDRSAGYCWCSGWTAALPSATRMSTPSRSRSMSIEDAYDHLRAVAERLLGSPLPRTRRRWAGVYSQATGPELYHRSQIAPGVVLVTGPGSRGMTCAPAIAEETFA
jgi:glycine/D-amino acid oxidase-like deaminating enzyme